jgi:hypothetical protein
LAHPNISGTKLGQLGTSWAFDTHQNFLNICKATIASTDYKIRAAKSAGFYPHSKERTEEEADHEQGM